MLVLLVLASDAPEPIDMNSELFILEIQPVFQFKFDELKENYQVFQIAFNNHIKGAKLDQFISHPQKVYPIGVDIVSNFLFLAFPSDTLVNQIQYFGSSLSQSKRNVKSEPFNKLLYYRYKDDKLTQWERENFDIVNNYRIENGKNPFKYNKKMNWIARTKSLDMNINMYYEHESPFYGGPGGLFAMFGLDVPWSGENIMRSGNANLSPSQAFYAWQHSPGHNANMLSGSQYVGIGCFLSHQVGSFWTQQFMNLDDKLIDSFQYGDNLVLEAPYKLTDPVFVEQQLHYVGIAFLVAMVALAVGAIIALTIKKFKKQTAK